MKKILLLVTPFFVMSAASAGEIRNAITDSVQLTVASPSLQTTRQGASYSVSGTGLTIGEGGIGGWDGTATNNAPDMATGAFSQTTAGDDFSFSQTINYGDTPVVDQTVLSSGGRVDEPVLYGNSTQYQGGTAGSLAGTLSATSVPTVTAGGAGTTAIGQRVVELTVFD